MGAYFGVVSKKDVLEDVFFGTDYHSHLGTKSGGVVIYDRETGLQRKIHNLGNAPFRTKFKHVFGEMKGTSAIGVISDYDPQPLIIRSRHGVYAICTVGVINNATDLADKFLNDNGGHFGLSTGLQINSTELVASLIDQKDDLTDGVLPEDTVYDEDKQRILHICLGRIEPELREVLQLVYFEGMSYAETATVLGVNAKRVDHLLTRAKEHMRRELQKEGITDAHD